MRLALAILAWATLALSAHAQGLNSGAYFANAGGATAIPVQVASVAALRAASLASQPSVILSAYYAGGTTGGGILVLHSSDTTSADNGCTIFKDAAGDRFYRQLSTPNALDVSQCGAKGDGTTDDTAAVQAALNIACANAGVAYYPITTPSTFKVAITSALSFKVCFSLVFEGIGEAGSNGVGATYKWKGAAGPGPMFDLNQANTIRISNIVLDDTSATPLDVVIEDTESGSITATNTNNELDNLDIKGPASADSNFIGIQVGANDTVGNVDIGRFDKIAISCGPSGATATSNGVGIQFGPAGSSSEPFVYTITHSAIDACSKAFDLEDEASVNIDTGNFETNYTDFYITSASNLTISNIRSELATAPVVITSGGYGIAFVNDVFAGLTTGDTGVLITGNGNTSFVFDRVTFDDVSGQIPFDLTGMSGSAIAVIQNSRWQTNYCPPISTWSGSITFTNNFPAGGPKCPNTMVNTSLTITSWTVAHLPSGTSAHAGEVGYVTDANATCTAGTTPTGGGSHTCFVGYNGTAWVEFGI